MPRYKTLTHTSPSDLIPTMNVEVWKEGALQQAFELYKQRLGSVHEQAARMVLAENKLRTLAPSIAEFIDNKTCVTEVVDLSFDSQNNSIRCFSAIVEAGRGQAKSVYHVWFEPGMMSSQHGPYEVKVLDGDTYFISYREILDKPNIWKKVNTSDRNYKTAIALALYGLLPELTTAGGRNFARCVSLLGE